MFPRVKVICARALHQVSAKDVEDILTCPTHSWLDQVTVLTLITAFYHTLNCHAFTFVYKPKYLNLDNIGRHSDVINWTHCFEEDKSQDDWKQYWKNF